MVEMGLMDAPEGRIVQRAGDVEADDFGAERVRQRAYPEAHERIIACDAVSEQIRRSTAEL
jgi:hypothetical protein